MSTAKHIYNEKDIRTFADYAKWKQTEQDNLFSINVLKNLVTNIITLPQKEVKKAITDYTYPGAPEWDRLICGVAEYTLNTISYKENYPQWIMKKHPTPKGVFYPVGGDFWYTMKYGETPIELKTRAVCLSKNELKGI